MLHELKFKGKYLCDAVCSGAKKFEIRKNDRNYKVNDIIKPVPVDDECNPMEHPISNERYRITWITTEWENILADGYCVFAIEPLANYARINKKSRKWRMLAFLDSLDDASLRVFSEHHIDVRYVKEFRKHNINYKIVFCRTPFKQTEETYSALAELHEKLMYVDPEGYDAALSSFAKAFGKEYTSYGKE